MIHKLKRWLPKFASPSLETLVSKATIEVRKAIEEVPKLLDEVHMSTKNGIKDMEMHMDISKVSISTTTSSMVIGSPFLIPSIHELFNQQFKNLGLGCTSSSDTPISGIPISSPSGSPSIAPSQLLPHPSPPRAPCSFPSLGPPHSSYNLKPQPLLSYLLVLSRTLLLLSKYGWGSWLHAVISSGPTRLR